MAGVPVTPGRTVLYQSALGATVNPAIVVQIPTIQFGGLPNETPEGNPEIIDLQVISMSGIFPVHGVRHESFGTEQHWRYPEIV